MNVIDKVYEACMALQKYAAENGDAKAEALANELMAWGQAATDRNAT